MPHHILSRIVTRLTAHGYWNSVFPEAYHKEPIIPILNLIESFETSCPYDQQLQPKDLIMRQQNPHVFHPKPYVRQQINPTAKKPNRRIAQRTGG